MTETVILASVAVWLVLVLRNCRKHGCGGECEKCSARCKVLAEKAEGKTGD